MSFCESFCKRIHGTKGQFSTPRLWGSACFVVCASCILLALHRVGTHMSQQTVLKEQGLKTTVRKLRFIITVAAFVIHWFDVLERFSINFLEEWLLLLYKNLRSFLFPCLQWFIFCWIQQSPSTECYHFMRDTHSKHRKTTPKAQRIIYSDSNRSLFYSETANDICSTMC